MQITLELPTELGQALAAEAKQLGIPLSEYAVRLLSTGHSSAPAPKSGAELVAYWQREGLIGSRPDITDSQAHAHERRRQAEGRLLG